MNVIAGIAVALEEAQSEDFVSYAQQTLDNAKTMAEEFIQR